MVDFRIYNPSNNPLDVQSAFVQSVGIGSISFSSESLTGPGPLSTTYFSIVTLSATGAVTLPTSSLSNGLVKQVYNNSATGVGVAVNTSPTGTLVTLGSKKLGDFLYYNNGWINTVSS